MGNYQNQSISASEKIIAILTDIVKKEIENRKEDTEKRKE